MADFVRSESGLLFSDNFKEDNLLWQLSPNDYSKIDRTNGLRIIHNEKYTTYTIQEPDMNFYSCFCELNHVIHDYKDIAGIIILSNTEQYAECQSCKMDIPSGPQNSQVMKDYILSIMDKALELDKYVTWGTYGEEESNPGDKPEESWEDMIGDANQFLRGFIDKSYKYIRFDKTGKLYSFYASEDGIDWIEVGNTIFADAGRIGFFVSGTEDASLIENSSVTFKSFYLFKNKYLTLDGLAKNKFEIKLGEKIINDKSDIVSVQGRGRAVINLTEIMIPMNGQLNLYQNDTLICSKELQEGVGGDIYTFTYDIRVSVNDVEIDPLKLFNLGTFIDHKQTFRISIYSNENYTLKDIPVALLAYSEYYSGAEPINISLYDEANNIIDFKKELLIHEILPGEGVNILIGLDNTALQNFYSNANSFRFKLNIG